MIQQVKNRKKIAQIFSKKIQERKVKKIDIVKKCDLSKPTFFNIINTNEKSKNYSIDAFLSVCNELKIKVYIEY